MSSIDLYGYKWISNSVMDAKSTVLVGTALDQYAAFATTTRRTTFAASSVSTVGTAPTVVKRIDPLSDLQSRGARLCGREVVVERDFYRLVTIVYDKESGIQVGEVDDYDRRSREEVIAELADGMMAIIRDEERTDGKLPSDVGSYLPKDRLVEF